MSEDAHNGSPTPAATQHIPLILRETPRWCRWKRGKNKLGKWTKFPDCSTKDPDARRAWRDIAHDSSSKQGFGFITGGRIETPRGYLIALDYDNCRDPKTGKISKWAREALVAFNKSFAEVSPSGYGLRQWVLVSDLPTRSIKSVIPVQANAVPGCTKSIEVQLFGLKAHGGGYVTVTGDQVTGTSNDIQRVRGVETIFEHFDYPMDHIGEELEDLPEGFGEPPSADAIDDIVRHSPNGDALLNGDWEELGYESASHAFADLEQLVMQAAYGHGGAALDYLLDRTAWGHGDIDNSKDPGKYEREEWVHNDLLRVCGKRSLASTDAFDELPEEEFEALPITNDQPAPAKNRPIAHIRSPEPADEPPAPRRYLLRHPDGVGLLPVGKVGLLSAAGGTGKTTALVQLAICVATGKRWFDHYVVADEQDDCARRVLFLMGEEDEEEVQRKLWHTMNAMGLDIQQRAEVAARVECVPLAGHPTPLIGMKKSGAVVGTVHSDDLLKRIEEGEECGLVIVDPLSRFCGINVESDNVLATRFVSELERFAAAHGNPTVLAVGHVSKQARQDGQAEQRGVTGLYDAVRWASGMVSKNGQVTFEVSKNNYAPPVEGVLPLVRGDEGHLSIESDEVRAQREAQERLAEHEQHESDVADIMMQAVRIVADSPGINRSDLKAELRGANDKRQQAIRRLVESGEIVLRKGEKNSSLFFPGDSEEANDLLG